MLSCHACKCIDFNIRMEIDSNDIRFYVAKCEKCGTEYNLSEDVMEL
jgi:RNase P subunit RPR2